MKAETKTQKRFKVDIDPPTRTKIERFAKATRRKHIDVVALAMDALIEQDKSGSSERSGRKESNVAATTV